MKMNDKKCRHTDYLTPERILEPVRAYFGGQIGFDPATTQDNPTNAAYFRTAHDFVTGLEDGWHDYDGGVFVNPPYGRGIRDWTKKIWEEASCDAHILALLPGQRFEQFYWQRDLFNPRLTGYCMVRKRINFLRQDGTIAKGNPYGSFIYLYNGDWDRFKLFFGDVGLCAKIEEMYTRIKK